MAGPDEMGGANGMGGTPDAGDGMDLDQLLGTSPQGETTQDLQGGFPGQGGNSQSGDAAYKFAGRTWKGGQREAETAWNKMYGQYSEKAGLLNQLKQIAQSDPELAQQLAQDPRLAGILAKLGIEGAEQSIRGNSQREEGNVSPQDYQRELVIERNQNRILREEWGFERKLGRPLTEREQQAVYKQIERSENLSYEEAYFLAHREQIMKRQAQQNAGAGQGLPQQGGRPKPPPRSMPGTPAPGKKSVSDMSEAEWKQNLRESGVVKELMSRGMSQG